jgi:hypothetical protein
MTASGSISWLRGDLRGATMSRATTPDTSLAEGGHSSRTTRSLGQPHSLVIRSFGWWKRSTTKVVIGWETTLRRQSSITSGGDRYLLYVLDGLCTLRSALDADNSTAGKVITSPEPRNRLVFTAIRAVSRTRNLLKAAPDRPPSVYFVGRTDGNGRPSEAVSYPHYRRPNGFVGR